MHRLSPLIGIPAYPVTQYSNTQAAYSHLRRSMARDGFLCVSISRSREEPGPLSRRAEDVDVEEERFS